MVHYFASMRCLASVLLVALILFTLYLQSWSKFSLQAFDCSDPVDLKTLSNQDCINHHEKKRKKSFALLHLHLIQVLSGSGLSSNQSGKEQNDNFGTMTAHEPSYLVNNTQIYRTYKPS